MREAPFEAPWRIIAYQQIRRHRTVPVRECLFIRETGHPTRLVFRLAVKRELLLECDLGVRMSTLHLAKLISKSLACEWIHIHGGGDEPVGRLQVVANRDVATRFIVLEHFLAFEIPDLLREPSARRFVDVGSLGL